MAGYQTLTPEIAGLLREAADGHIFTGEDINEDYSRDEMPIYGRKMPDLVVQPRTTEEVSAVLKICNEYRIPVTPRGAGTGLVGAAVPVLGGVLIDMTKMNRILEYDMANLTVRVQPGVLLNDLAADAASRGLLYPPDPGEKFATLGGNVSTNAGGMRAVKYGSTRDYVLAMTAVLASGEVLKLGAAVSKTSTGYSLLHLMIGSEGTLGIITELTLKLIPAPKVTVSLIVPFPDLETGIAAVPKLKMAQLDPQAVEFMERESVLASEKHLRKSTFPKEIAGETIGAYLLITFDGKSEEDVNSVIEEACGVLLEAGAIDILVADTPDRMRDAWAARSGFLEAIEAQTRFLDECDVVVPVDRIAQFLDYSRKLGAECGLEICAFGHAGDGNLHIYQCSNDLDEEEFKRRVDRYFRTLYPKAAEIGGLLSGEHGIGRGKLRYLGSVVGDEAVRLMLGIKKVFDPNLILNPGKVCCPEDAAP